MADSTIKPDSGNDLVLQNNGGTGKIEINDGAEINVTLGSSAGDDLNVGSGKLVVEGDTGNVGIGKSPVAKLDVKSKADNANDGGISIEANSNTNRLFQLGETTSQTAIQQMYSGNTEKVRLHANGDSYFNGGNLGIGTASPSEILDIVGSSPVIRANASNNGGTATLELAARASDGSPTENRGQIVSEAEGSTANTRMVFKVENSSGVNERMRMNSSGDIYSTAWTTRTWTLTGVSSTSNYYGAYKRIGYFCYITGYFEGTSNANTLTISNLPYTAGPTTNNNNQSIGIGYAFDGGNLTVPTSGVIVQNTTVLEFKKNNNGAGWSSGVTVAIMFSGWYQINSI